MIAISVHYICEVNLFIRSSIYLYLYLYFSAQKYIILIFRNESNCTLVSSHHVVHVFVYISTFPSIYLSECPYCNISVRVCMYMHLYDSIRGPYLNNVWKIMKNMNHWNHFLLPLVLILLTIISIPCMKSYFLNMWLFF